MDFGRLQRAARRPKRLYVMRYLLDTHALIYETHKDPFDRFIIGTAKSENLAIITADDKFRLYKDIIEIIW